MTSPKSVRMYLKFFICQKLRSKPRNLSRTKTNIKIKYITLPYSQSIQGVTFIDIQLANTPTSNPYKKNYIQCRPPKAKSSYITDITHTQESRPTFSTISRRDSCRVLHHDAPRCGRAGMPGLPSGGSCSQGSHDRRAATQMTETEIFDSQVDGRAVTGCDC